MKHRNIMAVLFFSIITLGIYDLFWLVSTKKVLNEKTKVHTPTLWLLFAPILVFIPFIVVMYTLAGNGSSRDVAAFVIIFEIVAFLAIVPITFYWFFKFSKAVNEYTSGEMNTAVTFLLLWLLRFIGLAVLQDKFNEMADGSSTGTPVVADAPVTPVVDQAQDVPVPGFNPAPPEQPVTPPEPPVATPTPTDSPEPTVHTDQPPTPTVG